MPHKWEEEEEYGGAIAKVGDVREILGGLSTGNQYDCVAVVRKIKFTKHETKISKTSGG